MTAAQNTVVDNDVAQNTTPMANETIETTQVAANTTPETAIDVATNVTDDNVAEDHPQGATETEAASEAVEDAEAGPTGDANAQDFKEIPTVAFAHGKAYTMDTPVGEFEDWMTYLLYCEDGPALRILCAKEIDEDGNCVAYSELKVSQKLLTDHSAYFTAMLTGPWEEADEDVLRLPTTRIEDFKRLYLTLQAGGAASRINLGKPTTVITNLAETYMLADYFDMPIVASWLKDSLRDYLAELRAWPTLYVNQILDNTRDRRVVATTGTTGSPASPGAPKTLGQAAEEMHKDKVADFGTAYLNLKGALASQQIMNPDELMRFLVSHAPRPLLASSVSAMEPEFKDDFISAYLLL